MSTFLHVKVFKEREAAPHARSCQLGQCGTTILFKEDSDLQLIECWQHPTDLECPCQDVHALPIKKARDDLQLHDLDALALATGDALRQGDKYVRTLCEYSLQLFLSSEQSCQMIGRAVIKVEKANGSQGAAIRVKELVQYLRYAQAIAPLGFAVRKEGGNSMVGDVWQGGGGSSSARPSLAMLMGERSHAASCGSRSRGERSAFPRDLTATMYIYLRKE